MEELTVDGVCNVARPFDLAEIREMRDAGVRLWIMDIPPGAVTCTPMGSLLIEMTTKSDHAGGLRTSFLAAGGVDNFAGVASNLGSPDKPLQIYMKQVPEATQDDVNAASIAEQWKEGSRAGSS